MTRELLKQALDALENICDIQSNPGRPNITIHDFGKCRQSAIEIRAHLAKPHGEPVAVVTGIYGGRFTLAPVNSSTVLPQGMALYTHQAHTEQDVQELIRWYVDCDLAPFSEAVRRILGVPAP